MAYDDFEPHNDDPRLDVLNQIDFTNLPGGSTNQNTGITGGGGIAAPKPFDREQYKTGWSGGTADQLKAYNDTWGVQTNKDVSYLPTGEAIDMIGDVGGANKYGWTGLGSWSGTPGAGASISPYGGGGGQGGGATGPGSSGGSAFQDQIRSLILSQLGQLSAPVNANDPILTGQTDAYRNERTRGAQNERAALAERDAFTGLNSGGAGSGSFETGMQGINEGASSDIAGNKAQVMGKELESRRQNLNVLLNMALQSGDAESARALQLQIAQMDNQLRQMGLAQSQSQFNDQLGYNMGRSSEDDLRWRILLGLDQ